MKKTIVPLAISLCMFACKEIAPPACEELKQGALKIQNNSDSTYYIPHIVDSNIIWITVASGETADRDVPAGTYKLVAKGKKRKEQITTVPQCGNASFLID